MVRPISNPARSQGHDGRRHRLTVWLLFALLLAPFVAAPTAELAHWVPVEQGDAQSLHRRLDQPVAPILANDQAAPVKAKRLSGDTPLDVVLSITRSADRAERDFSPATFPREVVRDLRRDLELRGYRAQAPPTARRV